jgi:hypothetical protein
MAYGAYSGTLSNLCAITLSSGREIQVTRICVGSGGAEAQIEPGVTAMPVDIEGEGPAPTMANSSAHTVATTETALVSAASTRAYVLVQNTGSTNPIYVGTTGVTTTTGFKLEPGASIPLTTQSAIAAIASGGSSSAVVLIFTRA